jgi:uncharacterized phage-associated protein
LATRYTLHRSNNVDVIFADELVGKLLMRMAFDEVKATQTAGSFLRLAGGRLQYLALIKMLYMLDREALHRWSVPVTTDKYVSMKLGPVTSRIYNFVKVEGEPLHPSYWSAHIQRDGFDAVLISDIDTSELSVAEDELVAEIYSECAGKDGFELAEETHKRFPEWSNPGSSSTPIDIADILAALETSESGVAQTESLVAIQNALFSMTRG